MFSLKRMIFSEKMRIFMSVILLVVFVVAFTIMFIINETNTTYRIYSIVLLAFLTFFYVIAESLKLIYRKAINKLNIDCDPETALKTMKTLERFDVIHGYRDTILVFKTLVYYDLGMFEELRELIENKLFTTSASLKLVKLHNQLYLALHDKKDGLVTQYFKQIEEEYILKKPKRKRAKLVYNIGQVRADYYLNKQNLYKAEESLKTIDIQTLNYRERIYYYLAYAKLNHYKKNQKEETYLAEAKAISENQYHIVNYGG